MEQEEHLEVLNTNSSNEDVHYLAGMLYDFKASRKTRMSRTLPTIDYPLTDPKAKDLPAFVLAKVKSILAFRRYVEEDLLDEDSLSYAETQGCLTSSIEDITKSLMIEIEDLSYAIHFVYPGGSSAWVRLDNPLSFEAIPEHLLSSMRERDPSIWWIVSNTDYALWPRVIKVKIMSQDQITEAFPEIR